MSSHIQLTVLLDPDLKRVMDGVKVRRGVPIAAQVRLALVDWLRKEGETVPDLDAVSDGDDQ